MADTPEAKVKKKIRAMLVEHGALFFSPVTGGYGVSGVSDIIALYKGRFIAIEAKADAAKKPTELQTRFLKKVLDAGGIPMLIHKDNLDELKQLLDDLDTWQATMTSRATRL